MRARVPSSSTSAPPRRKVRANSETPRSRHEVLPLLPDRRKTHTRSNSPVSYRRKYNDIIHMPYQDHVLSERSDSPQLAVPVENDDRLAEWYEQNNPSDSPRLALPVDTEIDSQNGTNRTIKVTRILQ